MAEEIKVLDQEPVKQSYNNPKFQCRMYEEKFPEVDNVVMVNIRQIADIGAYVSLLEYNNIEGMVQLSELSKKRIRSIQKLIRVGKNEVAIVMRVDKEKGYIDLSKKRASPEDIALCEERFTKSKAVHSIMRMIAEHLDTKLEDLYTAYTWPLYKKYGHAYDAFKIILNNPEKVFEDFPDMPQFVKDEYVKVIKKRMTPQPVKIRADIECTCFAYEGIEAVKKALLAGEACSTSLAPIKIKLVAPPLYVMTTNSTDKLFGVQTLEKAIQTIDETIKSLNGHLSVKMKPRAVSENDDVELQQLMDKLAVENTDVAGDDDVDEQYDVELE